MAIRRAKATPLGDKATTQRVINAPVLLQFRHTHLSYYAPLLASMQPTEAAEFHHGGYS